MYEWDLVYKSRFQHTHIYQNVYDINGKVWVSMECYTHVKNLLKIIYTIRILNIINIFFSYFPIVVSVLFEIKIMNIK